MIPKSNGSFEKLLNSVAKEVNMIEIMSDCDYVMRGTSTATAPILYQYCIYTTLYNTNLWLIT